MVFSYIEFVGLVQERIFRPMIPVSFGANGKNFNTYCLIDSGADYTILPIEAAKTLELKLSHEDSYRIQGAGGNDFKVYRSPIEIELRIQKQGFRPLHWKSKVHFSEAGTLTLLGYKGFFEFCDVNLQSSMKELLISGNKKCE